MLHVRLIDTEEEFFRLEDVWEALLVQSASDGFFLTWTWLRVWWEIYREDYQLLVVLAEDETGVCGIAPFAISRDGRLEIMGSNAAWGEYLDLIVKRGREQEVTVALLKRVLALGNDPSPRWRTAFLRFVRRDAVCAPYVRSSFADDGRPLAEIGTDVAPYITLPSSWQAYLATRSSNFRSWISRNEHRLARLGPARLLLVDQDVALPDAFARMDSLHANRWGKPFEPRFAAFHCRLSAALLPLGRLALALLDVGGEVVAARYDFCYAGKMWCYQGGWRRDLSSYRLGSVTLSRVLQWAIESGFSEYDFLAGDVPYKRRWSNAYRETVDLTTEQPKTD